MSRRYEDRYNDCRNNSDYYRDRSRFDDFDRDYYPPYRWDNHDETVVDVHVEVPNHCRYY